MEPRPLQDSTVAIVGLGLMGGSLALALRARRACAKILGVTRNAALAARAVAQGLLDQASADLALIGAADVIILAMPVRAIIEQLPHVGQVAREGAMVIDVGSTKRHVVRAMEGLPAHVQPIGAHPMCGKEQAGFDAADADLYQNAVFVLTPLARTSPSTVAFAQTLAAAIGARPLVLDPDRHDRIVAATSHAPFALAVALMRAADRLARDDEALYALAASGFRDTSRLAASDTTMMLDVLLTNGENVAGLLRDCSGRLAELAQLVEDRDEQTLRTLLERAAASRRQLLKTH